jgi:UPF0176 protein
MHFITTFYKFFHVQNPEQLKADLEKKAAELNIRGLVILGKEGINSTSSSTSEDGLEIYKNFIRTVTGDNHLSFKNSKCEKPPFRRFKVKIRDEIVTLGNADLFPDQRKNHHLTPTEWNKVMKEEEHVIIDTRNWYETKIGTFKGAINPKTEMFTEFPEFFEKHHFPKNKKLLIFCTGGIRCEKGILELQRQGYDNVYQLEGGILKYLEEYPHDQFEGECFVFDHRVAVDQKLEPSKKYKLCPHCGQPAATNIDCKRCDTHAVICEDCSKLEWKKDTCSKNCAYQFHLHPDRKGKHQELPFEIEQH